MNVTKCGSLKCQKDSYARSLSAVVMSCVETSGEDLQHGQYEVQLEDTVLFPEGGGQVARVFAAIMIASLHCLYSQTTKVALMEWL